MRYGFWMRARLFIGGEIQVYPFVHSIKSKSMKCKVLELRSTLIH